MKTVGTGDLVKPLDGTNYSVNMGILDNADGKPRYYPGASSPVGSKSGNLSDSDTHFRMTMKDIERNTVLVPDISLIQPGDLLVQYDTEDREKELQLGIVVGLGWETGDPQVPQYGEAANLWWNYVYVVGVRPGMRQVILGTWGNPSGMFGGFSENPESCQIRRLLKVKNTGTALTMRDGTKGDEWEIVKETLKSLSCEVMLPNNWDSEDTTNRWVPNTPSGLGGIKITLKASNASKAIDDDAADVAGAEMPLENYDIVILPPADRFFTATELSKADNIYVNKGTGIEIWVEGIDTAGEKIIENGRTAEYLLATFRRKGYNADEIKSTNTIYQGSNLRLARDYYRDMSYNTLYFDENGKGKNSFRLHTSDIQISENDQENGYKNCLVFEGDFWGKRRSLYRFKVKVIDDNEFKPGDDFLLRFKVYEVDTAVAEAKGTEYIAVYDHKFLWRANYYIDETINEDNMPSGRQDWNDLHPWTKAEGNLWDERGDGKQCKIKPWTRQVMYLNPNATGPNPFTKYSHTETGPFTNLRGGGNVFNSTAYSWGCFDSVSEFNSNMIDQAKVLYPGQDLNALDNPTLAPVNVANNNDWYQYSADSYRPGFGWYTKIEWDQITNSQRLHSAGNDCSGLIYRCSSYSQFYKISGANDDVREIIGSPALFSPGENISNNPAIFSKAAQNNPNKYLSLMIPGDVVFFPGHVFILNTFRDKNDNIIIDMLNEIILIESADWGLQRVQNNHLFYDYKDTSFTVYRLTIR